MVVDSTTVTSASANFTSADVGKVFFAIDTYTGAAVAGPGTITSVVNAHTIKVSVVTSTGSSKVLTWGTDDTAALKAAWTAAELSTTNGFGQSAVYVPSGGYLFSSCPFSPVISPGVSLLGDGVGKTIFYPHPSFDFSSTQANSGMLLKLIDNITYPGEVGNFSIEGSSISFTGAGTANTSLLSLYGSHIHDITVYRLGGGAQNGQVGGVYGIVRGRVNDVRVGAIMSNGAGGGGIAFAVIGSSGVLTDCVAQNSSYNLTLSDQDYANFSGQFLSLINFFVDEGNVGGTATAQFINSNGVLCVGCQFYTAWDPSGGRAVSVDGTSSVRFVGCNFGPFFYSYPNSGGLTVASGGIAFLNNCDLRSNAGGKAIINNGTIWDLGGNTIDAGGISGTGVVSQMLNNTVAASASAGSNGAVPSQVDGYLVVSINGINKKIPYFAT